MAVLGYEMRQRQLRNVCGHFHTYRQRRRRPSSCMPVARARVRVEVRRPHPLHRTYTPNSTQEYRHQPGYSQRCTPTAVSLSFDECRRPRALVHIAAFVLSSLSPQSSVPRLAPFRLFSPPHSDIASTVS